MIDDDRMQLSRGEAIETMLVRFRTLGCYPLTGAVESTASDLSLVLELLQSRTSERQGRAIDSDSGSSMEKKKQRVISSENSHSYGKDTSDEDILKLANAYR